MKHLDKYLEHCAGLYSFLAWLEEESALGMPYEISNQVIYLDKLISRYFSFGTVRGSKELFIAIQPSEAEWFGLVSWSKIILKPNSNYVYFLANTVLGDQEEQPDIPCFAIALSVDTIDKIKIFHNIEKLIGREYFQDDAGNIHVNFHKKLFSIPVEIYDAEKPIIPDGTIFDYSHILANKEMGLQSSFSNIPEFVGDVNEAQSLLSKWKDREEALKKNAEKLK